MDGENNGKPLLKLMIWAENHLFLETPKHVFCDFLCVFSEALFSGALGLKKVARDLFEHTSWLKNFHVIGKIAWRKK